MSLKFLKLLSQIDDPRRAQGKKWQLGPVLLVTILAILSGATSYRKVHRFIEAHRERLNQKYRSVNVNISDLKVLAVTRDSVTVRFKQDYRADGYRDYGLKEIVLVKKGNDWKIKKEEWQALGG